jgi:hypothetical protein
VAERGQTGLCVARRRGRRPFCQARLVNAGVMDPNEAYMTAYAKAYGTRTPPQ